MKCSNDAIEVKKRRTKIKIGIEKTKNKMVELNQITAVISLDIMNQTTERQKLTEQKKKKARNPLTPLLGPMLYDRCDVYIKRYAEMDRKN